MKIERYTLQKRIEIIEIHYKNYENLAETVSKTRTFLGRREAPCRTAIKNLVEKFELHPHRVIVWCGLWSGGVIGPYFFENEAGATVNRMRYREMINDCLWPKLDSIDLPNVYCQQEGAMCHTSNETIDLLRVKFPDRVISRRGDRN